MSELNLWLLAFGTLLVAWCLYWGVVCRPTSRRLDDYFLAGRDTPAWVFVLAATALSVTGWLALGHPALVYADGLSYAETALGAVVIPLAGILFLKRQWLFARRFGHTTPAALLGDYYGGELLRLIVVGIAIVFAVPFVGMQLSACGRLIEHLSGGEVDRHAAAWIIGFAIFVQVYLGGLAAVTAAGALQCLLMLAGMVGLGCLAYAQLGGFGAFNEALAALGAQPGGDALLEIPGVIQFTAGLGKQTPHGGVWTTATVLGYALALAGVQAAPSFSMLGFSARDARGFAPQQVWASGAIVGVILVLFAVAAGLAAHLPASGIAASAAALDVSGALLQSIAPGEPWLAALLAVCLLAAIALAAAACTWTTAAMLSEDIYRRYIDPRASVRARRVFARSALAGIFILALAMGTFTPRAQAQTGALALSFALQLWPALAGLCWLRWVTKEGALLGLCAGLVVAFLTEPAAGSVARWLGFDLPWGRWPWTIHSAAWGFLANAIVCALVSLGTRGGAAREQRDAQHALLDTLDPMPTRRHMRPAVWALSLAWLFFAVGPGSVIGNDLFGSPSGGLAAWRLGIPSLWAWQIIWWALGVFVIWWLAYKMELASAPKPAPD